MKNGNSVLLSLLLAPSLVWGTPTLQVKAPAVQPFANAFMQMAGNPKVMERLGSHTYVGGLASGQISLAGMNYVAQALSRGALEVPTSFADVDAPGVYTFLERYKRAEEAAQERAQLDAHAAHVNANSVLAASARGDAGPEDLDTAINRLGIIQALFAGHLDPDQVENINMVVGLLRSARSRLGQADPMEVAQRTKSALARLGLGADFDAPSSEVFYSLAPGAAYRGHMAGLQPAARDEVAHRIAQERESSAHRYAASIAGRVPPAGYSKPRKAVAWAVLPWALGLLAVGIFPFIAAGFSIVLAAGSFVGGILAGDEIVRSDEGQNAIAYVVLMSVMGLGIATVGAIVTQFYPPAFGALHVLWIVLPRDLIAVAVQHPLAAGALATLGIGGLIWGWKDVARFGAASAIIRAAFYLPVAIGYLIVAIPREIASNIREKKRETSD